MSLRAQNPVDLQHRSKVGRAVDRLTEPGRVLEPRKVLPDSKAAARGWWRGRGRRAGVSHGDALGAMDDRGVAELDVLAQVGAGDLTAATRPLSRSRRSTDRRPAARVRGRIDGELLVFPNHRQDRRSITAVSAASSRWLTVRAPSLHGTGLPL